MVRFQTAFGQTSPADGRVLSLIESFLTAGIIEDAKQWTPEAGAPQGAVLSPLWSNIYLDPLDHLLAAAGLPMVRYADDFVSLCRTAAEAVHALDLVRGWVTDNGLTLHPTKTRIVDVRAESFAFLGYEFAGDKHWPRKKSLQALKDTLRRQTRRTSGESLRSIVFRVNRSLRGWFAYFQHSSRRSVYKDLDGWLRSLLRRRQGGRGVARKPSDCFAWPNRYFADQGLFSLAAAYALACQSSCR